MSEIEHRAADQDTAIEQAFVAGTLPEEDRRSDAVEAKPSEVDSTLAALSAAGVGSVFEKTATGWNVKYVDGGTIIHVQGATIPDAIASHGSQVVHPKTRDQLAREAAESMVIQ